MSGRRILKPIMKKNRHVICEMCCKSGDIETHVLTKNRDEYLYKAARSFLRWGDRIPLPDLKRPMNVRFSPSSVCPITNEQKKNY